MCRVGHLIAGAVRRPRGKSGHRRAGCQL